MKLRNLIFILLALSIFSFIALATSSFQNIFLVSPANNTFDSDGAVTFIFNATGNTSLPEGYSCTVYHNGTGSWASGGSTNTNVTNATYENITLSGLTDGRIGWTVGCTSSGNSTVVYAHNSESTSGPNRVNYTIAVDTRNPRITPNTPGNGSWVTLGRNVQFNVTPSDENLDFCWMQSNLDESLNSTSTNTTFTNFTINLTSAQTNLSLAFQFGNKTYVGWLDNNTAIYKWNVQCNDTAGNYGSFLGGTTNLTNNTVGHHYFYVDSVLPTQPNITRFINVTSTDLTPLFQWLNVTDLNFSRYVLSFSRSLNFETLVFQRNITSVSTNLSLVSGLEYNRTYFVRVTAWDLANNSANSSPQISYITQGSYGCALIVADIWNICAIVNTAPQNASAICDDVGCTYVSMYNATHEFQTYTAGSATNDEMRFIASTRPNESSVIFIYRASTNSTWENRTWDINTPHLWYNLTNLSTGWNIVPILNQTGVFGFGNLDRSVNGNGTNFLRANNSRFMSYFTETNNSGGRYVPYIANRSFNNATQIPYGEAVWVHLNRSILYYEWNSSLEIT